MKVGEVWVNNRMVTMAFPGSDEVWSGMFDANIKWEITDFSEEYVWVVSCDLHYSPQRPEGKILKNFYFKEYFLKHFKRLHE